MTKQVSSIHRLILIDSIHVDELKSILLNLNINVPPHILEDYREVHSLYQGADSSRNEETITWEQFKSFYKLILMNQSTFYREIFNGKKLDDMDLNKHLADNEQNLHICFKVYDKDDSGFISFPELKTFLRDLNLHRQFATHFNPEGAFDSFCHYIWNTFDRNTDGKICFDEFVRAYNAILDR